MRSRVSFLTKFITYLLTYLLSYFLTKLLTYLLNYLPSRANLYIALHNGLPTYGFSLFLPAHHTHLNSLSPSNHSTK